MPTVFDRFSTIMLAFSFMREKIINNNDLSSFETGTDESPPDIDLSYQSQSLDAEEAEVAMQRQALSSIAPIVQFLADMDSENFCKGIVGQYAGTTV